MSVTADNISVCILWVFTRHFSLVKIFFSLTAIRLEFLKPLTDLEVKEKQSARFECEISRPGVKVNNDYFLISTTHSTRAFLKINNFIMLLQKNTLLKSAMSMFLLMTLLICPKTGEVV